MMCLCLEQCGEEEWKKPWYLYNQLVKAHWHYEDWFCKDHACESKKKPLYKCYGGDNCDEAFYEKMVNVYPKLKKSIGDLNEAKKERRVAMSMIERHGAILMDRTTKRFLLVKDARHNTYMFPRGKINKKESPSDCLIRELKEEVNLDLNACWKQFVKEVHPRNGDFNIKLLCFVGDFEDCKLKINCKKEISEIRWMSFDEIVNASSPIKFHMVTQFLFVLRKMLRFNNHDSIVLSDTDTDSQAKWKRNAIVNDKENLETFGVTTKQDHLSVADMMRMNAEIEHREILKYDGNPNSFGEVEEEKKLIEVNLKPLYHMSQTTQSQSKAFSFDYCKLVNCFC